MRIPRHLPLAIFLALAPGAAFAQSGEQPVVSVEEAQDIAKNAGVDAIRSVELEHGYWVIVGTTGDGRVITIRVDARTGAAGG